MTSISWTGQTWNPVVGCSIVSKGCTHCYAMGMAHRLGSMAKTPHYRGLTQKVNGHPVWTGRIAAAPDHIWQEPLRRRKPTTWFVNSMGDLFHDDVPTELVDRVFAVMALCPRHTFQILTKRPDRMRRYLSDDHEDTDLFERIADLGGRMVEDGDSAHDMLLGIDWPLPNVWLGTSVEDQATADCRIPLLLDTPAAVRWVSAEPLLGPVDISAFLPGCYECSFCCGWRTGGDNSDIEERCHNCDWEGIAPEFCPECSAQLSQAICPLCNANAVLHHPDTITLDWVICGGESGPDARPMHPDWARTLRDQCAAAGIPFHFKQWGEWFPEFETPGIPFDDDPEQSRFRTCVWDVETAAWEETRGGWDDDHDWYFADNYADPEQPMIRIGRKAAGNLLDGVAHDAIPPHAGGA